MPGVGIGIGLCTAAAPPVSEAAVAALAPAALYNFTDPMSLFVGRDGSRGNPAVGGTTRTGAAGGTTSIGAAGGTTSIGAVGGTTSIGAVGGTTSIGTALSKTAGRTLRMQLAREVPCGRCPAPAAVPSHTCG